MDITILAYLEPGPPGVRHFLASRTGQGEDCSMTSQQPADGVVAELLPLPSAHGARAVALSLVVELRKSYERFEKGSTDGLHELRVAARRLRSWLRAFRPELADTVRGKCRMLVVPQRGRVFCLGSLDPARADAMLSTIAEAARA